MANWRRFDEVLETEWRKAVRDRTCVSLLMIDADHFRAYNDSFGHQRGDDLLRRIATCIAGHVHRPADLVARYGGEEFAVLLPRTDLAGALAVAGILREAAVALGVAHPGAVNHNATVSIGAACMRPSQGRVSDALVTWADTALYRAKLDGRDCCRSDPVVGGQVEAA